MKLQRVADINSGVYSSTISEGEVFYIQARDFDENRQLASNLTPILSYTKNLEKHFLQHGDVLIVAKGAGFLSAVYNEAYTPAVASTVFLVIRLFDKSQVAPEYLSWYLNQDSTQSLLLSLSRGTSIPSINKKMLMELDIPVPSMEKQKIIIELSNLKRKENRLKTKINELRNNQLNQLILNEIKK